MINYVHEAGREFCLAFVDMFPRTKKKLKMSLDMFPVTNKAYIPDGMLSIPFSRATWK